MSKRAAIYARVSTDEQAEGNSLDSQVESCRKYAGYQGLEIVKEYRDDFTGARIDRPRLQELLKEVVTGTIEAVIVYDSSRWSRDVRVTLELRDLFIESDCELHYSTRGKIRFDDDGEFQDIMESGFNQRWKKEIQKYTSNGRNEKAGRDKKPVMSGFPPFGYRRTGKADEARMEIDPQEAETVRYIFRLYVYGDENRGPISLRGIAIRLNELGIETPHYPMNPDKKRQQAPGWIPASLRGILTNEIYAGITYYGKTRIKRISPKKAFRIKQPHEKWIAISVPELAIIDRGLFDMAQQRGEVNIARSRRNQKHEYLLSGFFRCGICNNVMAGSHWEHEGYESLYYRCGNHWHKPEQAPCPNENKTIAAGIAEPAVWNWLVNLWSDEDSISEGLRGISQRKDSELEPKRRQLVRLRDLAAKQHEKATKLISQLSEADDPLLIAMIKDQAKKEIDLRTEFENEARTLAAELEGQDITPDMIEQIRKIVEHVRTGLLNPTYETKRAIFNLLSLRAIFRVDDSGRWLDISCGLCPEGDVIALHPS